MTANNSGEISIVDVINIFSRGKKIILLWAVLFAAAGAGLAYITPNRYVSEVKVVNVRSWGNTTATSGGGLTSSLASLALGGVAQDSNLSLALQMITTVRLAERLNSKYDLLTYFYGKKWHRENGQWVRNPSEGMLGGLRDMVAARIGRKPSTIALAEMMLNQIEIKTDKLSGVVTISYSSTDPEFAGLFLGRVVAEADGIMRENDIVRTEQRIAHLQRELDGLQVADLRSNLLAVMANEVKSKIFMLSGAPYAMQVLDGPVVSDRPVSPKPVLNVLIGFLLGCIFGVVVVFVVHIARELKGRSANAADC